VVQPHKIFLAGKKRDALEHTDFRLTRIPSAVVIPPSLLQASRGAAL